MAKQTGAVTGGIYAGALSVVLSWSAAQLHVEMPAEVATAWGVLLVGAGSWIGHRLSKPSSDAGVAA